MDRQLLNALYRQAMDNARLSCGPMLSTTAILETWPDPTSQALSRLCPIVVVSPSPALGEAPAHQGDRGSNADRALAPPPPAQHAKPVDGQ